MSGEKRLIDANAMREDWLEHGENEYVHDTNAVLDSIDAQPTVDAVEVVYAHWINVTSCGRGRVVGFCSNCKTSQEACNHSALRLNHKYCRWCGAKMDGDTK